MTDFGSHQSGANYALFLLGLFASVLLHEMAHAFVASRFGVRTTEIVMFPIGGLSRMERALQPTEELWISLAGPVVNLLICGGIVGLPVLLRTNRCPGVCPICCIRPIWARCRCSPAATCCWRLFNLLPAFPDGRRPRSARAAGYIRPEDEATRIAAWMGRMLAISMGLYGLVAQEFMLVFFAFFIYLGAAQEGAAAMGRTLTHGIPVRAAMITEFHTLGHGNTVRDAANLLLSTSQQDFPVMHGGSGGGIAGPQSAAEGAGGGRSGRLRRRA